MRQAEKERKAARQKGQYMQVVGHEQSRENLVHPRKSKHVICLQRSVPVEKVASFNAGQVSRVQISKCLAFKEVRFQESFVYSQKGFEQDSHIIQSVF